MKRFLIIFSILFFCGGSAFAESTKVEALTDFSTINPATHFKFQTLDVINSKKNDISLPAKTIINGIILKVEEPKRGKQDSSFVLIPTSFIFAGQEVPINNSKLVAKIYEYEPIDKKELTFSISRKVLNFLLRGLVSAIEFTIGAAEAENGTRIKSGMMKAYNDSVICYIEKGKQLEIKEGDILVLKFKRLRN